MTNSNPLAMNTPRFAKRGGTRRSPKRRDPTSKFTWPLERLGTRMPCVLREYAGERHGIELGYAPCSFDRELFAPVLAANGGEIACALESSAGGAISIDHGSWATHYTGLSRLFVVPCRPSLRRRETVRAGQVIGYAAKSPIRIGFELYQWTDDRGFVALDPLPHMASWLNAPTSSAGPAREAA